MPICFAFLRQRGMTIHSANVKVFQLAELDDRRTIIEIRTATERERGVKDGKESEKSKEETRNLSSSSLLGDVIQLHERRNKQAGNKDRQSDKFFNIKRTHTHTHTHTYRHTNKMNGKAESNYI